MMPLGLVVFDLDGTLLRGLTTCQVLAEPLGQSEAMLRFEALSSETEIATARQEVASWYRGYALTQLHEMLKSARWAPGAREAIGMLRDSGCEIGIASITWRFAVAWFAEQLGVEHYLGTGLSPAGEVDHVWGRDKGRWVQELAQRLEVSADRLAAVGDTSGDEALLSAASMRFFVGTRQPPSVPGLIHLPDADLRDIAGQVLRAWAV
jgi:HAD superfamily phosphoserine phosphatase-like hydrolase